MPAPTSRGASSPLLVVVALVVLVLVVVAVVTRKRHDASSGEISDSVAITETVPTVATVSPAASTGNDSAVAP